MTHYLAQMGQTMAIVAGIGGLLAIHPRSRKLAYVLIRYGKRHAPRWAVVLMVAPIPGPIDEIAAIAGIIWTFRSSAKRQVFARYVKRALA